MPCNRKARQSAARTLGGGTLVFPCRDGKPISEIRLPKLLQVHKIAAVQHGFCSSFRNWTSEPTNKPEGRRGHASAVDSHDAAQRLRYNNVLGHTVESFLDSGNDGRDGTFTGNRKQTAIGRPDRNSWMKTRLTPHYISLVYEACLKSFWRRKALANFLRQCGVSEQFLQTWTPDESKREVLDRLFLKLPKSDSGRSALVRMASFLIEQGSFPDLKNWEDSAAKLKEAHDAVSQLRRYHSKQQQEIQSEEDKVEARRRFAERQRQATQSQQTLRGLNDRLNALAQSLGEQKAGYDFQDWFYELLDFFEITNRKPYAHKGRQIDGSLTVSGTTYLVELKFTVGRADATDIDSFYKKITTKADNTMGVMVSISGYSSVAKQEASGERTPMLLLDHSHLYMVLGGMMGLGDLVDRVRRHASQTGEAYLAADDFGG